MSRFIAQATSATVSIAGILSGLKEARRRRIRADMLRRLDDRTLHDIGVQRIALI